MERFKIEVIQSEQGLISVRKFDRKPEILGAHRQNINDDPEFMDLKGKAARFLLETVTEVRKVIG